MYIKFQSDNNPDLACLEKYLSAGEFGALPDAWRHHAEQDLKKYREGMVNLGKRLPWLSDEVIQKASEIENIELPTRYDSPSQFRILRDLVTRVQGAANQLGLDTTNFPYYSCIPTGLVNACAVNLPNTSRPFLLFDSELFLYCHLFAKAFARCLPKVGHNDKRLTLSLDMGLVNKRIKNTPELAVRLVDLIYAYSTKGSPSKSTPYSPEAEYLELITILRDGMELFIVAHEFGHVYSNHIADIFSRFNSQSIDQQEFNLAHQQEHEADLIGLVLTLQAMGESGYDSALSYVGIELFFTSLEMADKAKHIINNGRITGYKETEPDSHPSNTTRRKLLRDALSTFIKNDNEVKTARRMAKKYLKISDLLWKNARMESSLKKISAIERGE